MNKTDNAAEVGMHKFELAGLGKAPFRFVGASENKITYPDGSSKPGGTCDYCSNGILLECRIKSADGKISVVGSSCIEKVGDRGLLKAYRTSPEVRQKARLARDAKAKTVFAELSQLLEANKEKLAAMPHPDGFVDLKTGVPLTFLDWVNFVLRCSGNAGRERMLKRLKRVLAESYA